MLRLGVVSKINPLVVLRGHFNTFGDAEHRGRWKDILLFYIFPGCIGLYAWNSTRSFNSDKCADTAVNILAIFVPLAFSVLAELFSMVDRKSVQNNNSLKQLATDLFWNISYGIFVSIIALSGLLVLDFMGISKGRWFTGVFVATALHFFFTTLMVLKRFAKLMDPSRR